MDWRYVTLAQGPNSRTLAGAMRQAADEQDSEKLLELVEEIDQLIYSGSRKRFQVVYISNGRFSQFDGRSELKIIDYRVCRKYFRSHHSELPVCFLGQKLNPLACNRGMLYYVSGLWSLLPLHDFELHLLTFLQALVSFAGDGAEVNENIRSILPTDKAISFCIVKPFHLTL